MIALLVFTLLAVQTSGQTVDLTLQPATRGKDVVEATVRKIHTIEVFTKDKNYLRRIACAETNYGQAQHTYQIGNGGIWSISERIYQTSKDNVSHPFLTRAFGAILKKWGINWSNAKRLDLEKPFYSGLAARLFWLATLGDSLPGKLPEQARIWKQFYNTSAVSAAQFEHGVQRCEEEKCSGRLNICIMMDGSGSIFDSDFELEKKFVSDLLGTFVNGSVRAAVVVYSTSVNVIFSLNSTLTWTEKLAKIQSVKRPTGTGTSTHLAIQECNKQFRDNTGEANVARVGLVLTDGQSDSLAKVREASSAAAMAGVTSYAVGVGTGTGAEELLVIAGDISRVLKVGDFEELRELFGQINEDACKVPQTPLAGQAVKDTLSKGEKRYFRFELPETGVRVSVENLSGETASFYSYEDETPSSALHDGKIENGAVYVPFRDLLSTESDVKEKNGTTGNFSLVYVSVAGLQEFNEYVMRAATVDPSELQSTTETPSESEDTSAGTNTSESQPTTVRKPSGSRASSALVSSLSLLWLALLCSRVL